MTLWVKCEDEGQMKNIKISGPLKTEQSWRIGVAAMNWSIAVLFSNGSTLRNRMNLL
jgi:hypothetical protein